MYENMTNINLLLILLFVCPLRGNCLSGAQAHWRTLLAAKYHGTRTAKSNIVYENISVKSNIFNILKIL